MNYDKPLSKLLACQLNVHQLRVFARAVKNSTIRLKYVLATALFIAVFFSPAFTAFARSPIAVAANVPTAQIVSRSDAETYYLSAVNQLRSDRGQSPLIIDARLTISAAQKTSDMMSQAYWGHYAPNGRSFSDYIWGVSPKADKVGENLARCFTTRQSAFEALVASPTHYAIMTGQFTNFGVSEMFDAPSGCMLTTMHFSLYQ